MGSTRPPWGPSWLTRPSRWVGSPGSGWVAEGGQGGQGGFAPWLGKHAHQGAGLAGLQMRIPWRWAPQSPVGCHSAQTQPLANSRFGPGFCLEPQVLLGLLLLPPVVAGFTAILQRASPWVGLQVRRRSLRSLSWFAVTAR